MTPSGDPLNDAEITSVLSTPFADTVTVVAAAPEAIKAVPKVAVPEAILVGTGLPFKIISAG